MSSYACNEKDITRQLTWIRYDFEYEDDDNEETGDVGVENKYYNAKQLKLSNPKEAIAEFLEIPSMEEEKGDWCVIFDSSLFSSLQLILARGFKGLKQAIKLEYKLKQYDKVCAESL